PSENGEDGQDREESGAARDEAAPDEDTAGGAAPDDAAADDAGAEPDGESEGGRRGRARRGAGERDREEPRGGGGAVAKGVVEVLGNGSAFLRVDPPEASDADVYISAAQVRRCELVSGDEVTGPVRTPRRSERYP